MGDLSHCEHPERTQADLVSKHQRRTEGLHTDGGTNPSPVKLLHETRVRTESMDAGMTRAGLQRSKGFKTANSDNVRRAGGQMRAKTVWEKKKLRASETYVEYTSRDYRREGSRVLG